MTESAAAPTYHDLHITTADIERTSIFNLPYGLEAACTRVGGWQLWRKGGTSSLHSDVLLAGEYDGPDKWLVLDVAGYVIVDSRREPTDE